MPGCSPFPPNDERILRRQLHRGLGSSMAERIHAFDWSGTPVGPLQGWPQSLLTTVNVMLSSRQAMCLGWGNTLTFFYNDAYALFLDDRHPAALGMDLKDVWSDVWPEIEPLLSRALSGESTWSQELHLVMQRNGYAEDTWWDFSYSPVWNERGEIAGVLDVCSDATEKVRTERRLKFLIAFGDRLRDLNDSASIMATAAETLGAHLGVSRAGYAEIDRANQHVSVERDWTNGSIGTLAGESRPLDSFGPGIIAELRQGRTLQLDDIAADSRSAVYADGYASIGTRALIVVPLVKAGLLTAILYLHEATPRRWTATDVTLAGDVAERTWAAVERARAESALRLSESELRQADQRKDEFLAMLAHELRNPLAPIRTAAQILKLSLADPARVQKTSEIIVRQVEHMTEIVNDLLDVSRVTHGLVELELVPVDVRQAIFAAIEQCRPALQARSQQLALHLPNERIQTNADAVRLVQVISNLLSNAIKYTGDEGSIVLAVEPRGDEVWIRVQDNGSGIDASLLPKVFDLFTQAQRSAARVQGGLGLGLALVKRIVTLHGGSVEAHSQGPGCGSEFIVRLPLSVHHAEVEQARAQIPAETSLNGSGPSVLIVDDNRDAADLLATFLQTQGFKVAVEYNSHSAIQRASSERPDFVLLDIGLPEMDGHEVARRLRNDPATATATLIAITGYGQDADRQRSCEAGFDQHLVKPVDPEHLVTVLRGPVS